MDNPAALRTALALLLLMVGWFVSFWWFSPTGWIVGALLALVAIWVSPSPP
jgi:hypothetical protein